jgi:hypothetical protein
MIQEQTLSTGLPLSLFPKDYKPPSINIHQAVSLGMGSEWNDKMRERYLETVENFMKNSVPLNTGMEKFGLTYNEAGAITYYTSDATRILSIQYKDKSPYRFINTALAERNIAVLENWKPFLHYLLKGLNKLDNISQTVFRALNIPVLTMENTQYKSGALIVWITFTSTSKGKNQLAAFSGGKDKGTWFIIEITEGKDISPFSMFPAEAEVLLLPNCYLKVESIMTNEMKSLMNINLPDLNVLQLKQYETPARYKDMVIEEF